MQGKDKCGFKGICTNQVNKNSSVFEMHEVNAQNLWSNCDESPENSDDEVNDNLTRDPIQTESNQTMTKVRLTALSIKAVQRHVQHIDEVSEVQPTGTTDSIQKWAEIMFADPETNVRDESQQRAFEVIVSMFVITFHKKKRNGTRVNTMLERKCSAIGPYTTLYKKS
jgi:hypothetical protein